MTIIEHPKVWRSYDAIQDGGLAGGLAAGDGAKLQALLDRISDGSAIIFPSGQYLIDSAITVVDKSIQLMGMGGVELRKGFSGTLLSLTATLAWATALTSHVINLAETNLATDQTTVSTIGWSGAQTITPDDLMWIWSDLPQPFGKPGTVTGKERRCGEFARVAVPLDGAGATSVTSVSLTKVLYEALTAYTVGNNARIGKVRETTCLIDGITFTTAAEPTPGSWDASNEALIILGGLFQPVVRNCKAKNLYGIFIQPLHTYQASIQCSVSNLENLSTWNRQGYGIDDQGYETRVFNSAFSGCRHGYTTNTTTIETTAVAGDTKWYYYGRTMGFQVSNCLAEGSKNSGFDTHTGAVRGMFSNCQAWGSFRGASASGAGFSIRGSDHTVQNCQTYSCRDGVLIYEDVDGATHDITIRDNKFLDCSYLGIATDQGTTGDIIERLFIDNNDVRMACNSLSNSPSGIQLAGVTGAVIKDNRIQWVGTNASDVIGIRIKPSNTSGGASDAELRGRNVVDVSQLTMTAAQKAYPVYVEDPCTISGKTSRGNGLRVIAGGASAIVPCIFKGSGGGSAGTVLYSGVSADFQPTWSTGIASTSFVGGETDTNGSGGFATAYKSTTVTSADQVLASLPPDDFFVFNLTISGTTGVHYKMTQKFPAGYSRGQMMMLYISSSDDSSQRLLFQNSVATYGLQLYDQSMQSFGPQDGALFEWTGTAWNQITGRVAADFYGTIGANITLAGRSQILKCSGSGAYTVTLPDCTLAQAGIEISIMPSSTAQVTLATQASQTINGSSSMPTIQSNRSGRGGVMVLISDGANWMVKSQSPGYRSSAVSFTINNNDDYIYITVTAKVVTFPAVASNIGRMIVIANASGVSTTLTPNGAETIDGRSSLTLASYSSIGLLGTAAGWAVLYTKAGQAAATV